MHKYWAFGLTISSEIEFPELYKLTTASKNDVEIRIGKPPINFADIKGYHSDELVISPELFFLKIDGVASYLVENGKSITIEFGQDADINSMRLFCLSNGFAALLHQRLLIPLHASAFIYENELVLLMGDSGVGKSTTLAALVNKGYMPFSDDVCVPFFNDQDGNWYAYSSYPMMKYWANTLEKNIIEGASKEIQLRPGIDKYGIYFHEKFIAEPRKIRSIILLETAMKSDALSISELTGLALFEKLHAQAYRKEYLEHESLTKEHFILSSKLANCIKTMLISRPSNSDTISNIVGSVERALGLKN